MIFITLFLALCTYLIYKLYSKASKLPPGPLPFPLVGNFPQLLIGILKGNDAATTMTNWSKKYGPVHTFWLGPLPTVNICEYEIAHDAMVKKGSKFVDRNVPFLINVARNGRGVIISNGIHWLEQRRFALHSFRNMGLGRSIMEQRIMLEVNYRTSILDEEITKNGGSLSVDPKNFIELTVGNIINRMLLTERFTEEKEAIFFDLKHKMDEMMQNFSVFDFFIDDWNKEFPFLKQRLAHMMKPIDAIKQFLTDQVTQRKADIEKGEHELRGEGEDFVDAFLIQMQKNEENGVVDSFDEETLVITLLDLWLAGQETTATSLYWAFTYLALHPQVTARLQEELDTVAAGSSLSLTDKQKTPYLNAVITETLRVSSIVPLNLWRESSEDTVINGYLIPKGTAITAQLSVILADEKNFDRPAEFLPERHLIENSRPELVASFGLGKRACLGESLARAELYLIIGNFLLRYNISPSKELSPSMQAASNDSDMRRAKPYKINITARNK